jgi:hypothetical protein
LPDLEEARRARWERRVAPLLIEADACDGPSRVACALWARFVRSARPGQVAPAPQAESRPPTCPHGETRPHPEFLSDLHNDEGWCPGPLEMHGK